MSHDKVWPEYPNERMREQASGQMSLEGLERLIIDKAELERFEQGLKELDDVALPESGVYFDALEARIMGALDAAIESGEVEEHTPPVISDRGVIRLPLAASNTAAALVANAIGKRRSMSTRMGQLALLAAVALIANGKSLVKESNSSASDELRAAQKAAPQVLAGTVISHESEADLALEIAARRLVAYHQGE